MKSYLYILSAERPFPETELTRVKDEVCRLFECEDVRVADNAVFTIESPLAPDAADRLAAEASKKFRLTFKAGGKVS